jgi:hypothetical protein
MKPLYGQTKAIAQQALRQYSEQLMAHPNVEGLGLGLVADRGGANELKFYTVKIYVKRKPSLLQKLFHFAPNIPTVLSLRPNDNPERIVQVSTEIEEIGNVQLEAI